MDKELIEKVEKIVARQFDLVTNLTQEGYLDSLKMIAKEAIPIIAEELKMELEKGITETSYPEDKDQWIKFEYPPDWWQTFWDKYLGEV